MTPGSPGAPAPSRRDRRRVETIADIKAAARRQLDEAGPAGISMRSIARQLGMTATAVHYYFPGREALLEALIVDGFNSLAKALRSAYQATRGRAPHERWFEVCRAHRTWALERPSQYLLLYGHTGLPVRGGSQPPVNQAVSEVVGVLFHVMREALASGEIDTQGLERALPETLHAQLAVWRDDSTDALSGIPDGALAGCMIGYAQLHGAITLQLIGRIPPQLGDADALFELQMKHISASLRSPPAIW